MTGRDHPTSPALGRRRAARPTARASRRACPRERCVFLTFFPDAPRLRNVPKTGLANIVRRLAEDRRRGRLKTARKSGAGEVRCRCFEPACERALDLRIDT